MPEPNEPYEFVDAAEAHRLYARLRDALRAWSSFDAEQRRTLSEAVAYLVRTDDQEDDLRSPIGLEDDAEVIDAALRAVMRR
ncbi:MAG: hypothetical protein M3Z25_15850 [Actinomycetota bacterium]|nr:hypothetical protein [Actinomycetota bacterium]